MIQEGVLEKPAVDAIFGYHNWPSLPLSRYARKNDMRAAVWTKGDANGMNHFKYPRLIIYVMLIHKLKALLTLVDPSLVDPSYLLLPVIFLS